MKRLCSQCNINYLGPKQKNVCTPCYKSEWQRAKCPNKDIKYKPEFDTYLEAVQLMAAQGCNSHQIEVALNIHYGIVKSICKQHGIQLNKLISDKTIEARERLKQIIVSGGSIDDFLKGGGLSPKDARSYAATLGYVLKNSQLTTTEIAERLHGKFNLLTTVHVNDRLRYQVVCNNCQRESLKDPAYLDTDCCHCHKYGEEEGVVNNWVKGLGFETKTLKLVDGKHIDIYIPSLKIGIEYGGEYHHSEKFRSPIYHLNKLKQANSEGIKLFTIWASEWRDRQSQVQSFLKAAMSLNKMTLAARKCEVVVLQKEDAESFLNTYHIQGTCKFIIAYGLRYNNELFGVITGSHHHRGGYDLVLSRLCYRTDWKIIGGSKRLLKSLILFGKSKGFGSIISWSDNRWSEGTVYGHMGFILAGELRPDYAYTKNKKIISKQSSTKTQLAKRGGTGQTEKEMATSLGYLRIWDCGKKRWTMAI